MGAVKISRIAKFCLKEIRAIPKKCGVEVRLAIKKCTVKSCKPVKDSVREISSFAETRLAETGVLTKS